MYASPRALLHISRAVLTVTLTALGLRRPDATTRCAACPQPVDLAVPHVVLARLTETRTRVGRTRVHDTKATAVLHSACARTHEVALRPTLSPHQPPALLERPIPRGRP
jgi:hypothetical protein